MRITLLTAALLATICLQTKAQKIATFEVQLPVATSGLAIPASVNLDDITFVKDSSLVLQEVVGGSAKKYSLPGRTRRSSHYLLECRK